MNLNILKNKFLLKSLIVATLFSAISITGVATAAPTFSVSPDTNLVNGQKVTVTGSGFQKNATGAIIECNGTVDQPTILIIPGQPQSPISCTSPFSSLVTTTSNGSLPSTTITVTTGVTGPPKTGTDSNHVSAATDAALFPCPPTTAQIAAGDFCNISFGDSSGDQVSQNITFAGETTNSPTSTTSTTTTTPTSTTTNTPSASTSNLVNTGPGNVLGLFAIIAIIATVAHYSYTSISKKQS